jgi:hypothetical protein
MKSMLLLATLGVFTITARAEEKASAASTPPPVTEKMAKLSSFQGLKLGSEVSEIPGLDLTEDRGKLKVYTKKNDAEKLGPAMLSEMVYYAYDGKLLGVAVHAENGIDSSLILRILESAYGPAFQPDQQSPTYYWDGETATVRFTLNEDSGESETVVSSKELSEAADTYEKSLVEEAAKAL